MIQVTRPKSEVSHTQAKTYGDHVRTKRHELGITQKQVASQLEVNECSIYNWEGNRTVPAVRLVPRIVLFLGYCPFTPHLPVSEWLRLIRQNAGLSQERMAQALGVDEGTIKRWEAGIRQFSSLYRERINAFLKSLDNSPIGGGNLLKNQAEYVN
ncbi:MAG: helix-turn-helix transcriptional regulator [Pyrinomonadaceae bacterium]